jgi:predicted DNA-binding protein
MTKRNVLTIRVPEELKERIEKLSESQGVSINQFALYAFTKELGEIETSSFFKHYYKGKTKESIYSNLNTVLAKVQNKKVENWDKV